MKTAALSDTGKVRKDNQDSYFAIHSKNGIYFLCVADGMGGHKAGDVASRYTATELKSYFSIWDENNFFKSTREIKNVISTVNASLYKMALSKKEYEGMGTTLTLCITDGNSGHIFHVGDSRAYLISESRIRRLTKDHSLVQYMIDTGQITKEEARNHPNKNVITRCVGTEADVDIDFYKFELNPKDRVLLCSDGLYDMISDDEIKNIVNDSRTANAAVKKLVETANANGGSDNITAVLFEC